MRRLAFVLLGVLIALAELLDWTTFYMRLTRPLLLKQLNMVLR